MVNKKKSAGYSCDEKLLLEWRILCLKRKKKPGLEVERLIREEVERAKEK